MAGRDSELDLDRDCVPGLSNLLQENLRST